MEGMFKEENIGENEVLKADPPMVAIEGFEVEKEYKRTVRILNKSRGKQRCNIIPPLDMESPFDIDPGSKNDIMPGMYHSIDIVFCGTESKTYVEFIEIESSESYSFIIPLIAHDNVTSANGTIFPHKIQFPTCKVGEKLEKVISVQSTSSKPCKITLTPQNTCDDITIHPETLAIGPYGNVDVSVIFEPSKACTRILYVEVNATHAEFKPFISTITATSSYTTRDISQIDLGRFDKSISTKKVRNIIHNKMKTYQPTMHKAKKKRRNSTNDKDMKGKTKHIMGYNIPSNIASHGAVASVFAQDLERKKMLEREKEIIGKQREIMARTEHREMEQTQKGDKRRRGHPNDYSEAPNLQVTFEGADVEERKLIFAKEFDLYSQHENCVAIMPSTLRLGQKIPTSQQLTKMMERLTHMEEEKERRAVENSLQNQENIARNRFRRLVPPTDIRQKMEQAGIVPTFDLYRVPSD